MTYLTVWKVKIVIIIQCSLQMRLQKKCKLDVAAAVVVGGETAPVADFGGCYFVVVVVAAAAVVVAGCFEAEYAVPVVVVVVVVVTGVVAKAVAAAQVVALAIVAAVAVAVAEAVVAAAVFSRAVIASGVLVPVGFDAASTATALSVCYAVESVVAIVPACFVMDFAVGLVCAGAKLAV